MSMSSCSRHETPVNCSSASPPLNHQRKDAPLNMSRNVSRLSGCQGPYSPVMTSVCPFGTALSRLIEMDSPIRGLQEFVVVTGCPNRGDRFLSSWQELDP